MFGGCRPYTMHATGFAPVRSDGATGRCAVGHAAGHVIPFAAVTAAGVGNDDVSA